VVDNQHQQIPGYRDLSQEEVDCIASIKREESRLVSVWSGIKDRFPDADPRDLAMARTHFEDGFIRLVRSVARPDDPWAGPAVARAREGG
jgi:hypothetical protein